MEFSNLGDLVLEYPDEAKWQVALKLD